MNSLQISGLITSPPLRILTPALNVWKCMIKDLANEWAPDDVPWWHTERTLVGLLASSVWRCGGLAIEEYATEKKVRKPKAIKKSGQGDLWFQIKNRSFLAEAKKRYWSLDGKINGRSKRIKVGLRMARKDVVRTRRYDKSETRLGIYFWVPWRLKSKGDVTDGQIRAWVGELHKIKNAAVVWTFPRVARQVKDKDQSNGKWYYYPGVVMLIKQPRL